MMTIKEFASLCDCNTQTLRYYDRIDLLKPMRVDPWSGYRYYAKTQAIDFVKIRNLQAADFTIDEIKVLLGDETVGEEDVFAPKNSKIVWECHGWNIVYEFIDDIPKMEQGHNYCFSFRLTDEKRGEGIEFPLFMLAAMLPKVDAERVVMGCMVERSDDDQNHFVLLQKTSGKTAMVMT